MLHDEVRLLLRGFDVFTEDIELNYPKENPSAKLDTPIVASYLNSNRLLTARNF